jgi:hypothetical protein
MRKAMYRLALATMVVLLASCPTSTQSDNGGGSARGSLTIILFHDMKPLKTTDPTIAVSYDVLGSGPSRASFQELGITAATVTIESLEPGDWGVTVNGNNFKNEQIASASARVTIAPGETISTDVVSIEFVDNGSLDLSMAWPLSMGIDSVSAALTPTGGLPQEITLPAIGSGVSSIHATATVAPGYYTLSRIFTSTAGYVGGADAVQIMPNKTTTFVLTVDASGLNVTITPDISKVIPIAFAGQKDPLGLGNDMTVTATPTASKEFREFSYQWYLNGSVLDGQTTNAVTIKGKDSGKGSYRLDLVVSANEVLSSDSVFFSVK